MLCFDVRAGKARRHNDEVEMKISDAVPDRVAREFICNPRIGIAVGQDARRTYDVNPLVPQHHFDLPTEKTTGSQEQTTSHDTMHSSHKAINAIMSESATPENRPNSGLTCVKGGVIVAWGQSDICDPRSELHRRYEIGVTSAGRFHSADPGKLTMAPYFAEVWAERI